MWLVTAGIEGVDSVKIIDILGISHVTQPKKLTLLLIISPKQRFHYLTTSSRSPFVRSVSFISPSSNGEPTGDKRAGEKAGPDDAEPWVW